MSTTYDLTLRSNYKGITVGDPITYRGKDWHVIAIISLPGGVSHTLKPRTFAKLKDSCGYIVEVSFGNGFNKKNIKKAENGKA